MNKTKKLTQGAMMLAIVGAMIIIDRITTFFFSEIVVLIVPVVLIMYSAMQSLKDGIILSVGILIISFLLGNFQLTYMLYVPAGIITGLAFSFGLNKNFDKRALTFTAIIVYTICEILISFVIYPVLGFPVSQFVLEYKEIFAEFTQGKISLDSLSAAGINLSVDKIVVIIYIISTVVMGALEGIIISILSIFLLKRFKVKDLGVFNLYNIKPNKVLSYISFISLFSFPLGNYIKNETVYYLLICMSIIGGIILIYYGYIFVTLYGTIVLKRRSSSFVLVLGFIFPIIFLLLMIAGFLYGAGPLKNRLDDYLNVKHE